jgi:hypothetical protein
MSATAVALVGALAGLHAATWGAYKDSPYEGFTASRFLRSVVVGTVCATLVGRLLGMEGASLLVLVGVCYAAERLVTEWWKAVLRENPQSAFTIPMRLAFLGRPVDARAPRYAVGVLLAGATAVVLLTVSSTGPDVSSLPWWVAGLLGGASGWLTAFGGAWKDAPVEGFETAKFFRSPAVATGWALVLAPMTDDLGVLTLAAGGLAVAGIETYKTFVDGGAPGKFAGKPVRFATDAVRRGCRLGHAGTYGVLAVVLAGGLLGAVRGGDTTAAGQQRGVALALLWTIGSLAVVLGTVPRSSVVARPVPAGHADGHPIGHELHDDLRGQDR